MALLLTLRPNKNFLEAVGKVTVEFAKLESEISAFIAILIGQNDRIIGNMVTSELGFRQLHSLLKSLYRHKVSEQSKVVELESLLKICEGLSLQRNTVVHSEWSTYGEMEEAKRHKSRSKFKKGFISETKTVPIKELHVLAGSIEDAAIQIAQLRIRYSEENIAAA